MIFEWLFCQVLSGFVQKFLPADALSVGNDPEGSNVRTVKLSHGVTIPNVERYQHISTILSSNIENGTHVKTSFILAKDLQRNAISTTFFDFRFAPVRWNAIGHEVVICRLHICIGIAWAWPEDFGEKLRIANEFYRILRIDFWYPSILCRFLFASHIMPLQTSQQKPKFCF